MESLAKGRMALLIVLVASWFGTSTALAQSHFPLEITNIKPVGTVPSGLNANSRIYRAYPGLVYNIRAAVIGGSYPYSFTLSNAPAGMTVNANTGEVNWPDPQGNATPTLTIRDSAGAQITTSWPITVTSNGFQFVDGVNGVNAANNGCGSNCGIGTLQRPWRSLKDMGLNAAPQSITYFRSGTYGVLDMQRAGVGSPWEAVEFSTNRSTIWLAYPGASPVIDFGYTAGGAEFGPMIFLGGDVTYVDGFETRNSHIIGFQVGAGSQGQTFRRMRMHNHGAFVNGANSALIMTLGASGSYTSYGMVVQDSEFYNTPSVNALKLYSQSKPLFESNSFHDLVASMELKGDVRQFTVRANTMYNIRSNMQQAIAIGGNMHGANDQPTSGGEICFNNVRDSDNFALNLNQDGMATAIYVYRNTFRGGVNVDNTDAADGPFVFKNNVIVNNDSGAVAGSHVTHYNVSAPQRITLTDNLTGFPAANIIDANGNLTAAYAQFVGTRGHQTSGSTGMPTAPRNLRIVP